MTSDDDTGDEKPPPSVRHPSLHWPFRDHRDYDPFANLQGDWAARAEARGYEQTAPEEEARLLADFRRMLDKPSGRNERFPFRLSVGLGAKARAALKRTRKRTGLSQEEIVNRALSLYAYVNERLEAGDEVHVRRSDIDQIGE